MDLACALREQKGSCPTLFLLLREARERRALTPITHRKPVACGSDPDGPATPFASLAQRKPNQFILVSGSVPLRCAGRTEGVLSIHPPPRNAF
jgi:hypothetical protein